MSNLKFYALYLLISLSITVWVGLTLRHHGRKFLLRTLDSEELVASINHLLQVGFYLANVGYIALVFRNYYELKSLQDVLEVGLPKLGGVMLILGLVHLFNMLIIARLRRRSPEDALSTRGAGHRPSEVLGGPYHLRS